MTGPIGFSSSSKGLELGWALDGDQEQLHERLRRNIQQLDGEVHHQFGYDAFASFGLNYHYYGGVIDDTSAWITIPDNSIVLPDSAKEKPKEGEIVAVGSGKVLESGETQDFQVKVGDRVMFSSYAGTEVTVDGVDYLIMSESDVLAIVA